MKFRRYLPILSLTLALGFPWPATVGAALPPAADGDLLNLDWRVFVAAKPVYCILVEKDRQRLRVLRHDGRVQVMADYRVGTGAGSGPKEEEGDSRTPEGVYFITKRYVDHKLSVFGTRAYHLNYPNYFDLRAGRTGFGIFLHGTNKVLQPNSSNGCVTLDNADLDSLADYLHRGTAVFIVPTLAAQPPASEDLPELTADNFAGARTLLLPAGEEKADFASLYLIRINGQTVAVADYWGKQDQDKAPPKPAIAYLTPAAAGQRWTVGDRGPLGDEEGGRPESQDWPQVAVKVAFQRPVLEDNYLTLYRESVGPEAWAQGGEAVAVSPVLPVAAPTATVQAERSWLRYGLWALVCTIGTGFALRLSRRPEAEGRPTAEGAGPADGPSGDGEAPVAELRAELRELMAELATVRAKIEEDGRHEALQARLQGMEEALLAEREAESERRTAEWSAWLETGQRERHGRDELVAALRLDLAGLAERVAAVQAQMAERQASLAEQMAAVKQGLASRAAVNEVAGLCETLGAQVAVMAETLQHLATGDRQERQASARGTAELLDGLQACAAGLRELKALGVAHQAEEPAAVGQVAGMVAAMRQDLAAGCAAQTEFVARLDAMQAERAQVEAELQSDRRQLAVELAEAREQLAGERAVKAELALRLARLSELETGSEAQRRELTALQVERAQVEAELHSDRRRLATELDEARAALLAEQSAREELTPRLERLAGLETASESQRQAVRNLEAERLRLTTELDETRAALLAEQSAREELTPRLERLAGLETASESQRQAVQDLEGERLRLTAELDETRAALLVERSGREELARRLAGLEMTSVEARRAERAELEARHAAERERLAADLAAMQADRAELVVGRQVEMVNLSNALRAAQDLLVAEQRTSAALQEEVAALRQERSQPSTGPALGAGPEAMSRPATTAAGRPAERDQRPMKSSTAETVPPDRQILPADVLRKWMAGA